ncbi:MAG: hypothetical protein RMK20_11105, partial [Verrucomicrobiales bacterium]|nr:hypothetical protein [Verrucomicrobiales bacterium]
NIQTFELSERREEGDFRYRLEVEHNPNQRLVRIRNEQVTLNGQPLFRSQMGEVHLYRDNFSPGPSFSFDWTQSAFATLAERPDNQHAIGFRSRLANMLVAKLNPARMAAEADSEDSRLNLDLSNFAAWYRWLSQEHQGLAFELTRRLRDDLEGFRSFALRGEERKTLYVEFGEENGPRNWYRFDELSDGQRVLIALHVLKEVAVRLGWSLWLDEPENFLGLREIQPWLRDLHDSISDAAIGQAVLISHHPVLINLLAKSNGFWLDRKPEQPTRIKPIEVADLEVAGAGGSEGGSLTVADLVERGWLYE